MSAFSEKELLMLNEIGFIPGPQEECSAFKKRVDYCLNLKDHLPEELKTIFSNEDRHQLESFVHPTERLKKLYDCSPKWTPLFFNNYKLPFWQGGCAWIFQMTEDSPTSALIQLRQAFSCSSHYLGVYNREELLMHELCHVGRMMYQEPKFEELLAYRTANSKYRRFIGPLIQSSLESALFLLLLLMLIFFDLFLVLQNLSNAYFVALWLKIIPASIAIAALIRLWKRQVTYAACIKNLKKCIGSDRAEAVAYRLQDHEIILFSQMTPAEIKDYAALKHQVELRWQVIEKAYFQNTPLPSST